MENHAAKPIFNGHRHDARRAIARPGHGHGLSGRVDAHVFRIDGVEHLQTHAASRRAASGLGFAVHLRHGGDEHTGTDLAILGIQPLRIGNEDVVIHIQQAAGDLLNSGIIFSGGKVALLQDGNLCLIGHRGRDNFYRVNIPKQALLQDNVDLGFALSQRLGGGLGTAQESRLAHVHGGGHDTAKPLVNPHGGAGDHSVVDGINLVRNHIDDVVDGILREDLGVVRAGGNRFLENPLANFSGNHAGSSFS